MSWFLSLWLVGTGALAAEDPAACAGFRPAPVARDGVATVVKRTPSWSLEVGPERAIWEVALPGAGGDTRTLAAGRTADVALADGGTHPLVLVAPAAPTRPATKYDHVTWWRVRLDVPHAEAARLADADVVGVHVAGVASRGFRAAERRAVAEALRCAEARAAR